jgi:hypothetical protein
MKIPESSIRSTLAALWCFLIGSAYLVSQMDTGSTETGLALAQLHWGYVVFIGITFLLMTLDVWRSVSGHSGRI